MTFAKLRLEAAAPESRVARYGYCQLCRARFISISLKLGAELLERAPGKLCLLFPGSCAASDFSLAANDYGVFNGWLIVIYNMTKARLKPRLTPRNHSRVAVLFTDFCRWSAGSGHSAENSKAAALPTSQTGDSQDETSGTSCNNEPNHGPPLKIAAETCSRPNDHNMASGGFQSSTATTKSWFRDGGPYTVILL